MMRSAEKLLMSISEYLEVEANSTTKHEFYNGEVFSMVGASIEHNLLVSNLLTELNNRLKDKPCKVMANDLRINVKSSTLFTYPDVTVICGEIEKLENSFDTVTNPLLIVEVLSDSTMDYDRGSKFMLYRGIPTLREYLLVDSTGKIQIEKYYKNKQDIWQLTDYMSIDDTVILESIEGGLNVSIQDIYRGVYNL
jgi:Uma2 family endonuclease